MKTGEKIKKLRTEKSMTQSELAGSFITRNMLSLIESGSAQPSLQTIIYLAGRLNVPAGILVSDDDDEYFYRRVGAMENIRRAYTAGDFLICLDLCDKLTGSARDDELQLMRAECSLGVAKQEFSHGHLKAACESFDEACERANETVYFTAHILAEASVYCSYMRDISQSLYSDCADNGSPRGMAETDAFCRYVDVLGKLNGGDTESALKYTSALPANDVYASHIRAVMKMFERDHAEVRRIILEILNGSEDVQSPVMYALFRDLEICCREIGDFKGAYEYANAKVVMLERLLSEEGL